VEEISTKDLIVVTDLNPEGFPEWEPDSNTHRIIHNLIYGNIIPGDYPLENSIIEIYLKNPPKN
jgi:hypothetical protein